MLNPYVRKLSTARSIVIIVLLVTNLVVHAQRTPSREYQLKAIFLFNFTQFVDWPPGSFATEQSPLVIGILGENPFGSYLEETVSGEKVNEHSVIVQYYKNADEIKTCHILFINLAETKKGEQVVEALRGRNILTVSDAIDFLKGGGMVRFFTKSDKIKLQVNLEASKAANLVLSSKLLRLADLFDPSKNN